MVALAGNGVQARLEVVTCRRITSKRDIRQLDGSMEEES